MGRYPPEMKKKIHTHSKLEQVGNDFEEVGTQSHTSIVRCTNIIADASEFFENNKTVPTNFSPYKST